MKNAASTMNYVNQKTRIKLPKSIVANTNGRGYWSEGAKKKVKISTVDVGIDYVFESDCKKYLQVYINVIFSNKCWDVSKDGLIYTDPKWLKEFKNQIKAIVPAFEILHGIDYTEQGMQGDNFVSLCAEIKGYKKIKKFIDKIGLDESLLFEKRNMKR
jgi:hypothetical protein